MKSLKELIFEAESVAHLAHYEAEILPLTDRLREIQREFEQLTRKQTKTSNNWAALSMSNLKSLLS